MKLKKLRGAFGSSITYISILLCLDELIKGTVCQSLTLKLIQPASFSSSCSGILGGVENYTYTITVDTTGTTPQDWPRTLQFFTTPETGGAPSPPYLLDFANGRCIEEATTTFCSRAISSNMFEVNSTYLANVAVSKGTYLVRWEDSNVIDRREQSAQIPVIYDDSKVTLKVNGTEYNLDDDKCKFPLEKGKVSEYIFCADRADISSVTITFEEDVQTENQNCITRQHSYAGEKTFSFTYNDGCKREMTYSCSGKECSPGCSDGGIAGIVILSIAFVVAIVVVVYFICSKTTEGKMRILIIVIIVGAILCAVGIILIVVLDCTVTTC